MQGAHLAEQFQAAVGVVAHVAVEEAELLHNLVVRINPGVLAKGGVETLQLDERVLLEADDGVARVGRVEHVVVDGRGGGTDTVHTANALHESGGVPRRVVVDDDVGAVQVDAFGQHVAGDDDVIVVALLLIIIGVEVGADRLFLAVSVAGANGKDVVAVQPLAEVFGEVVDGVNALAENHQFAALVALGVKEFALQHLHKEVEFGVGIDGVPAFAESF